jgi:hypothetical protein
MSLDDLYHADAAAKQSWGDCGGLKTAPKKSDLGEIFGAKK